MCIFISLQNFILVILIEKTFYAYPKMINFMKEQQTNLPKIDQQKTLSNKENFMTTDQNRTDH